MPNLAATLKDEIRRLARKEIRAEVEPARKAAAVYRHEIARLKQALRDQQRLIERLASRTAESKSSSDSSEDMDPLEGMRFSARSVRAQRKRLKFSAEEFAKLIGVSSQTIYHWEQGKGRPRRAQFESLVAARRLSRREALDQIAHAEAAEEE
jgi:DNA-binding transcriptional regulator YiaG